jgi:hypothetical protein
MGEGRFQLEVALVHPVLKLFQPSRKIVKFAVTGGQVESLQLAEKRVVEARLQIMPGSH